MNQKIIAQICHETNRALCAAFGDYSQPLWEHAPDWQRQSAIKGVAWRQANPNAPVSAQHDSWSAEKIAAGWVYGPEKDPQKKTHPCLVSFEKLPAHQQAKDWVFTAIVLSAIKTGLLSCNNETI